MDTLHNYDKIIGHILTKALEAHRADGYFHITNFDIKNKNHLTILHVCIIAHELTRASIDISTKWLTYLRLKIKKRYRCIKLNNAKNSSVIDCAEVAKLISVQEQNDNILADIYQTYYEGK